MNKIKYLIRGTNHDESTWESGVRHETKEAAQIELKKWLNLKTVKEARIRIQYDKHD
jgi:hypothetical protein